MEFDTSARAVALPGNFHSVAIRLDRYAYLLPLSCRYDSLNVYQEEDPKVERWQLWIVTMAEVFLNPQPERVNTTMSSKCSNNQ